MIKKRVFPIAIVLLIALALVFSAFGCGGSENGGGGEGGGNMPTNKDPYCTGVTIKSPPDVTTYNIGDVFNPSGLVFDATFMIDGAEETITNMTYADCTYTHKGEPLTPSITEIVFNCFTYEFKVNISVINVSYTGVKILLNGLSENVLAGDFIDLTQLTVVAETASEQFPLSADSYKLTDNGSPVTQTKFYEMAEGKHTFGVTFLDFTDSVEITAWNEEELTVDGIMADSSALGKTFVVQEYVNLSRVKVTVSYLTSDGQEISLGDEVADWTITKEDDTPIDKSAPYQLLNASETFKVFAGGKITTFTVNATYYDTLEIIRRGGDDSEYVTQNSNFATSFLVRMLIKDTDKVTEVSPAQYALTAERNGQAVEGATAANVFSEPGEVTVTVTCKTLSASVTATVLKGYVVYTKDHYTTEEYQNNSQLKNFVEIPEGTIIKAQNPNDNGYEYIGDLNGTDVLIFHVWSDVVGTANVVFNASSTVKTNMEIDTWRPTTTASLQFNTVFEAFKGNSLETKDKYSIADDIILPGFTSQRIAYEESEKDENYYNKFDSQGRAYDPMVWTNWQPVNVGTISLVPGDNIITLRYSGGSGDGKCNLYSLELQLTEVGE